MTSAESELIRGFLKTMEAAYWPIAIVLGLAIVGFLPQTASRWIRAENLTAATVAGSLMLIGIITVFQWPVSLYSSTLIGLQKQASLAILQAAIATVRSLGAVAVLKFQPDLIAFFIWQLSITVLTTMLIVWLTRKSCPPGKAIFNWAHVRRLGRFTVGISLIGLLSIPLTQGDKIIVVRVAGLEQFGVYGLAATVSVGLYMIINSAYNALFPSFARLAVDRNEKDLATAYRRGNRTISALLFPVAIVLIMCPEQVILFWTGSKTLAQQAGPSLSLLAAAAVFHGLAHVLAALQFAYGWTRLSAYVNGIALLIFLPGAYLMTHWFGIVGSAFSVAALHAIMLAIHLIKTHRVLLPKALDTWIFDLARCMGCVAPLVLFLILNPGTEDSRWMAGAHLAGLFAVSAAIVAVSNRDLLGNLGARMLWRRVGVIA